MSDRWASHDIPPDPWLTPLWEDPDFIAENGLRPKERPAVSASQPDAPLAAPSLPPAERGALAEAEAVLGEFRGALRTVPRDLALGTITRLLFKEAAAYLDTVGAWIHPADLALRAAGATGSVLAALRGQQLRSALPVTLSSDALRPEHDAEDWARAIDEHADIGICLVRRQARLAAETLERHDPRPPAERLADSRASPDDPLALPSSWPNSETALISGYPEAASAKGSGGGITDLWECHRLGRMWRLAESQANSPDALTLARLSLWVTAHYSNRRPGPWLVPWLCRLPQRYRHAPATLSLFVDDTNKRIAWFQAVREAALEGLATLTALRTAYDVARERQDLRDTELLKSVTAIALREAVITTGSAAKACRKSAKSVLSALLRLESIGLLREITGRSRYRVWSCAL